ncbi:MULTISPECIES: hypothetical protein [Thiorhodovibrio]|uniref:hypothetical protein n=1 Tax=Thiorhodovibrio TaxID=61593 RepID=UPI001913CAC3|nr:MULTISPECIES: hypothetical protein [Thiorhodovibrio]
MRGWHERRVGVAGFRLWVTGRGWRAISAAVLVCLAFLVSGCGSTPTSTGSFISITGEPNTLLQGAAVEEARSVAMASARSKGWAIVSGDKLQAQSSSVTDVPPELILERNLSASSAQAVALGALPGGPAPKVRVWVTLVPQEQGTEVGLRAFVIVNPGTESEKQLEYTDDYSDDLAISLSALQSAWLATGHRLAVTAPVPEAPAPAPDNMFDSNPEASTGAESDMPESDRSGSNLANSNWTQAPWVESTPAGIDEIRSAEPAFEPAQGEARGAASAYGDQAAQVTSSPDDFVSGDTLVRAPTSAADSNSAPNRMLVLDPGARTGTWAYYAEQLARQMGCEVSGNGAVLLQKTPNFELHEVSCRDGANRLVKCEGGICRSMQ